MKPRLTLPVLLCLVTPALAGQPYRDAVHAGGPQVIPGAVFCAYFDEGGEGVSYHDTDAVNSGSGRLNPANGTYLNEFRQHGGLDTSYTKQVPDLDAPSNRVVPPSASSTSVGTNPVSGSTSPSRRPRPALTPPICCTRRNVTRMSRSRCPAGHPTASPCRPPSTPLRPFPGGSGIIGTCCLMPPRSTCRGRNRAHRAHRHRRQLQPRHAPFPPGRHPTPRTGHHGPHHARALSGPHSGKVERLAPKALPAAEKRATSSAAWVRLRPRSSSD
ncbi:hypothetical protein Verru16b_00179 [Lacunisphaera limnophila]|uniref:Uncharacterized protein n=1 Tax=Lacunisphaera limnophila TaxID=1838286 RepID=A0A1I7PHP8_9BACT|nr:hypothetical protein Verru16b_00179 [Lacunisphaera limnophila]